MFTANALFILLQFDLYIQLAIMLKSELTFTHPTQVEDFIDSLSKADQTRFREVFDGIQNSGLACDAELELGFKFAI
jgi:hypothetical protein